MKKIILTGGGTAGHVTPNIALIPELQKRGFDISYIGSHSGMEKNLITKQGITYHEIDTGKLRRYFSLRNFTDPFRVINGFRQAKKIIKSIKPDVVFSKGGFVTVPVVMAASALHIPTIIHESDMTPGLANKICIPRADTICYSFPETLTHLPQDKAVFTDSPIRNELFTGDKERAKQLCDFTNNKPVILIIGGSSGSVILNNTVRFVLDDLLDKYNIIHLCGKGKADLSVNKPGYVQFEYISDELKDIFALADIVISRAGANSICELKAIAKPNILVPLSKSASRGDQILNAKSYEKQGFSIVIQEEQLTKEILLEKINYLEEHKEEYIENMKKSFSENPIDKILGIIEDSCK